MHITSSLGIHVTRRRSKIIQAGKIVLRSYILASLLYIPTSFRMILNPILLSKWVLQGTSSGQSRTAFILLVFAAPAPGIRFFKKWMKKSGKRWEKKQTSVRVYIERLWHVLFLSWCCLYVYYWVSLVRLVRVAERQQNQLAASVYWLCRPSAQGSPKTYYSTGCGCPI